MRVLPSLLSDDVDDLESTHVHGRIDIHVFVSGWAKSVKYVHVLAVEYYSTLIQLS